MDLELCHGYRPYARSTLGPYIRGVIFMSSYLGTKSASASQPSCDSFSPLARCARPSGIVFDCLRAADSAAVMDSVRQVLPRTTINW
ncbi:hypothetical protein FB107DRAFT_277411 [Schizophyllum commune]